MTMTTAQRQELVMLARVRAQQYSLDPALVCAVIEQESKWDRWAINPEPDYAYLWDVEAGKPFRKLLPAERFAEKPPTDFPFYRGEDRDAEWWGQQMSWGLMQVMGAVARECGFKGRFLTEICDVNYGLEYGCRHLARKLEQSGGDIARALLRWNGGGNPLYPSEVMARMAAYQAPGGNS